MYQNSISSGLAVCLCALERFFHALPRNQRLGTRDYRKVLILLRIFCRANFAAKFFCVGKLLTAAIKKTVCFRKPFIFYTNSRNTTLFKFLHKTSYIVEVAIARICIYKNRHTRCIAHKLKNIEYLRPACFVRIAHTKSCRHRKTTGPNTLKTRLLGNPRRKRIMRLTQEVQFF